MNFDAREELIEDNIFFVMSLTMDFLLLLWLIYVYIFVRPPVVNVYERGEKGT